MNHRVRLLISALVLASGATRAAEVDLARRFTGEVRPFLDSYCVECHDRETRKAELDLERFQSMDAVVKDVGPWELVLERLRNGDMPPAKAKHQPSSADRKTAIAWIESLREREASRTAGDPGPVLPRRLSNAEYDHTIRDLTGVDIRPTRAFPVDPANQAGFDNSGESLAMSPALLGKYLQAGREVAEHLVLQPEGFTFAPHPVVADTDRDKWAVFRIVDFYRRQPTDYAAYFVAAWKFRHRTELGSAPDLKIEDVARQCGVSPGYLGRVWSALAEREESVGPLATLQETWRALPSPGEDSTPKVRAACEAMRDYVVHLRASIVPRVPNLKAPPIHEGSQTLVMWKNRQMAANRRRFDPTALKTRSEPADEPATPTTPPTNSVAVATNASPVTASTNAPAPRRRGRAQAETPEAVKRGGVSLAPVLVTTASSATAQMALKRVGTDPDLVVPAEPAERALHEAAFARFADLFPDAFYITERARVYLDAEKEQENSGRLLSAGLHSMTGYFRDDQPLYDLILDDAGRRELDRLWDEFDMVSSVPQRMHTSFVWFERTDSQYLRDPEFDPYRPEDKSVNTIEKVRSLSALYLAKARRSNAGETVLQAVEEHFQNVASNIARVEQLSVAAVPTHLAALDRFAERAWRRPLTTAERDDLRAFHRAAREENGVDHEEAMRDCVARILVSPKFLFRLDLVEATGRPGIPGKARPAATGATASARGDALEDPAPVRRVPLSDFALASRLSYFLWASMPDEALLARAAAGELRRSDVLRSEARRMLDDARVRNFATEFAGNWLDFRRFEDLNSVDRERFPAFNNELRAAMFEEPLRFFFDVVQRDRSVLDFIQARDTFVNAPLARHYGLPSEGLTTNAWVHVENARDVGRGGILPMAAFLTANSPGLRTSPVKRGNWVVKRVLGERIPPPPPVVPQLPRDEKDMGTLTVREALAAHRERTGCAECHARFDSFGLVFEAYGPVGERRSVDLGGRPVDTRAEFPGGASGDGLQGLVDYLHAHREGDFVENLCRKLLAYALGRTLILGDEGLIREMRAALAANDHRFSSLVDCVITSPQFLNKRLHDELARN